MKQCYVCKASKDLTEFNKRKTSKDGLKRECRECCKQYRLNNLKTVDDSRRTWREKNREGISAYNKSYRSQNPDAVARGRRTRDALVREATVSYYPGNVLNRLVTFYGAACLVPNCQATKATLDHVIPLSLFGQDAIYNFQPLCNSHNSSKGAWHSTDYRGSTIAVAFLDEKHKEARLDLLSLFV